MIALIAGWSVYTLENQRQQSRFATDVEKQRHALSKAFSQLYELQLSAQLYLQQEGGPTRDKFHAFIDNHTQKRSGLDSIMWLPRVNRAELKQFAAQQGHYHPFPPLNNHACQWVMRSDTFPALYLSPKAAKEGYLGWRADAQCENTVTMERAYFKRQPVARLIHDEQGHGVRWFAAITGREGQLAGFLATTLYFETFLPSLWQDDTPAPDMGLIAREAFGHQQMFATHSLSALSNWRNTYSPDITVPIAGSEEGLVVRFTHLRALHTGLLYGVLVGLLVLSLGLSVLASFWSYANRLSLAQHLVNKQTRQLTHQAQHDSLTGLANRAALDHALEGAIEQVSAQYSEHFTLLFIDLDRFKVVNDSLGHVTGDKLLKQVAKRLTESVSGERVFRFGGDEFIILLKADSSLALAQTKAKHLLQALSTPYKVDEHMINLSASIGIASVNKANASVTDIIQQADIAMYHAKQTRERLAIFQPAMLAKVQQRFIVEQDLKKGLANQQFHLVFQPIFDGEQETLSHAEALLRWQHPTLGRISPAEFIPIAEETGYIIELGDWVLEQVADVLDNWHTRFPANQCPSITVNVSAKQCQSATFADDVASLIARHQFAPQCLGLEMTETALLEHSETVGSNLRQLHALGIKLYLDDFGTGYSSLSLLRQYPFSVIKMDRSFIMDIDQPNGKAAPLCRGMIAMAHAVGLTVVAEGVETKQQLCWLRQHQCDYLQGYVLSRPIERTALEEWLLPQSHQRMVLVHG
ncbi:EAL domain-containing protein [Salinivibrio kushneri]|uniref:EAL domain-containing protein n=1 Tax=Salinivibrio kushneri TaxID=1908198 RepID=A0AA47KNF0_9GAMM|nr:EAL domain-containing protein [Salinivibrio kushneri]WBA09998.1 EAL domain-containing protein [Salinivibrio kushneri]